MNTIEDRIRTAAHAAADTVPADDLPPLRLPAERTRPTPRWASWHRASSHRAGWLAPAAAAVTVIAIVIAVVGIGRIMREPASAPASAASGGMVAGPPASSYVASGQVPPYYVAITSHGDPNFNRSYAAVRATASGRTLATIQATADDSTVVAATSAADDRTFVLDEQPWTTPDTNANQGDEPRTFYMFRLDASGRPGPLTRLPVSVPEGELLTGLALSPDGRKLALAAEPDNPRNTDPTRVMVYTLATGAVRTWTADGTIGASSDDARSLSWTADGRTLAFDWEGNGKGQHAGVWLLNLAARGSDLLAGSHQATSTAGTGWYAYAPLSGATALPVTGSPQPTASPSSTLPADVGSAVAQPICQEDSIITPDGSAVVCGAIAGTNVTVTAKGLKRGAVTEFREYSVRTGQVTRILGHWTFGRVGALAVNVLWSDASGSVIIGVIPTAGNGQVGVISGNEFTPLPAPVAPGSPDSGTW